MIYCFLMFPHTLDFLCSVQWKSKILKWRNISLTLSYKINILCAFFFCLLRLCQMYNTPQKALPMFINYGFTASTVKH